ncbi:MAG TPA: isochorismatase family protein [Thermomicrobiales bacterium]|nr:isochorismatase family protein [Thermomicrobiales bacterium]
MESSRFIEPERAALVLIDVQPLFLDLMAGEQEPLLARLEYLLLLAQTFAMPVIATFEQPVERNGWLPERLERIFPHDGRRYIKQTFNLCSEPEIRAAVEATGREQMIVAGAETDVCVLQSVLGLLDLGQQVFMVEDGLFTAEPNDAPALRRMEQAGAIPLTCKTLYYELKRSVAAPAFHLEWNRHYGDGDSAYVDPYDLPPSRRLRSD